MRRLIKILVVVAVLGVVLMVGILGWLFLAYPLVSPAPAITVAATPEVLERGEYVFNHVAACAHCHSAPDYEAYAMPPQPGSIGQGGWGFGGEVGVPGLVYASNITPHALATWSDGEILRALSSGVSKDGRALFPLMPWRHYATTSRADLEAVIAHVRTLPAVVNEVPAPRLSFPMNVIARTLPVDAQLASSAPDRADELAYGRYLVDLGACADCHSPTEHGEPIAGLEFAGGREFVFADGSIVRSMNITPDQATGLGTWTREQFIGRFQAWGGRREKLAPGQPNTPMPWTSYGGMTAEDLGAIFAYLRSLPPVANVVVKTSPAPAR
ncbi:MAG TPA: c-type cytochrome [Planctomycetota bacterium]|nr:c-type cytochrome [Planctomycetota bacterium]